MRSTDIEGVLTAPRSPWESPYLERAEPVIEYLQVENRGLGNNPIELGNEACRVEGSIACRNRFSGMLRYYCRQTAGSAPHRNLWIESEPRPVMEPVSYTHLTLPTISPV